MRLPTSKNQYFFTSAWVACTLMTSLCLTGCGRSAADQAEMDKLSKRVQQLEAENEQLKTRASGTEAVKSIFSALVKSSQANVVPISSNDLPKSAQQQAPVLVSVAHP